MATFTPPVNAGEVPPTAKGADRLMNRVCALYRFTTDRGRNVYYLSDGTVTETDPDGTTVTWESRTSGTYVVKAWYGGHEGEEVTAAQEAALIAAGYTV